MLLLEHSCSDRLEERCLEPLVDVLRDPWVEWCGLLDLVWLLRTLSTLWLEPCLQWLWLEQLLLARSSRLLGQSSDLSSSQGTLISHGNMGRSILSWSSFRCLERSLSSAKPLL